MREPQGLAVHRQGPQAVIGFELIGEPVTDSLVEGVSVDPGEQMAQRAGARDGSSQAQTDPQLWRHPGHETGDGRQGRGATEDGKGAHGRQRAEPVAAAVAPARIRQSLEHLSEAGRFLELAGQRVRYAGMVAGEDFDGGNGHTDATPGRSMAQTPRASGSADCRWPPL